MDTPTRHRRRAPRCASLLLIALLGAAAVAHGMGHLLDASCEASQGAQPHACLVCSALHGAQLPDSETELDAPGPAREAAPAAAVVPPPLRHLPRPGPTRAPPAA